VYGRGDEWLKIGNLKAFADGSLGSHTAWMVEPYTGNLLCGLILLITHQTILCFVAFIL
jgi:predicted amidohydrolase YtcJ